VNSTWIALLLGAAEGGGQGAPPGGGGGGGSTLMFFMPFIIIMVLFYLLLMRPQKREQQKRQQMLASIKKNDRVVTIGGIYGVVTNVRPEADEVTLKVDEATNAKLRMTLSSVARVLGDEAGAGGERN
jgi:preprotein translocase subunit YajC